MNLVYPVQRGVAIRGAHGSYRVRLPDVLLCRAFVCNSRINFQYFAEQEKNQQNATYNMLKFVQFA